MKRFVPFILLLFFACAQGEEFKNMNQITESKKINEADIKKLASKKIYFGHMSVGYNIIDGLKSILPADSELNIVETSDPKDFSKPVFAHSQNGENTKPETKIAAFIQKMDAGLGNKVDIAFFKFCYVDVTTGTDVNKLFNEYKAAMDGLIKKYPETTFLHVTVPVTAEDVSMKIKIKKFIKTSIGKQVTDHVTDNLRRTEYNSLLKNGYGIKVFDLTKLESSTIDSEKNFAKTAGTQHQALLKIYSYDGGHLNQKGREKIALELLKFINKF